MSLKTIWQQEWVRWILASVVGVVITALGYSYTLGSKIGEHLEGDKQKWQTNESDHAAFHELAGKTADRLDSLNTRVASIEGKVDTLLALQRLDRAAGSASTGPNLYAHKQP